MNYRKISVGFALLATGFLSGIAAEPNSPGPDFKEVYELLRSNLKGIDESSLNQTAVRGLLDQLHPQVLLVKEDTISPEKTNSLAISTSKVFDQAFGYFRFDQVVKGADESLRQASDRLAEANPLQGMIIDLRFARGMNYAAALQVADLFFATERPLIDWGQGLKQATAKEKAFTSPLAILVNSKTAGAAEAMAAILRDAGAGLVLGSRTAGEASQFEDFKLNNGQLLRIATQPIQLGSGKELPRKGLAPDVEVLVSLENEKAYQKNAYALLGNEKLLTSTDAQINATTNRNGGRLNEAELVRRHREGLDSEEDLANSRIANGEPPPPVVRDPVLARALDLVKGLALLKVRPIK